MPYFLDQYILPLEKQCKVNVFFNAYYAFWMMYAILNEYFHRSSVSSVSSASECLLGSAICDKNIVSYGNGPLPQYP